MLLFFGNFIGLDLDCGPFLAVHTEGAIRQGKLTEFDVNTALANTLRVQMRLGMFDGPRQPYGNLGPRDVCTPDHRQLALEAARQGIVLLQNRAHSPPLATRFHHTVAVIGPNSDVTVTMIGNYAGMSYVICILILIELIFTHYSSIFLYKIFRSCMWLHYPSTRYSTLRPDNS